MKLALIPMLALACACSSGARVKPVIDHHALTEDQYSSFLAADRLCNDLIQEHKGGVLAGTGRLVGGILGAVWGGSTKGADIGFALGGQLDGSSPYHGLTRTEVYGSCMSRLGQLGPILRSR